MSSKSALISAALGFFFLIFNSASPALAQHACPTPKYFDPKKIAGVLLPDVTYIITCLKDKYIKGGDPKAMLSNFTVGGSKPQDCMPMIATPQVAAVKSFPNLYMSLPDIPERQQLYRLGQDTRGFKGGSASVDKVNSMFSGVLGCKVDVKAGFSDPTQARGMATDCVAKFVLQRWHFPWEIFQKIGRFTDRLNEKACQPLRLIPDFKPEYRVDHYLNKASEKLKVPMLDKFPMPSFLTALLSIHPYQRIYDPSHPFSPRHDFEYNERKFYSPMTAKYGFGGSDPTCAVACAGVPVDVMRFRSQEFDACLGPRIVWNELACKDGCCASQRPCTTRFDEKDKICQGVKYTWSCNFLPPFAPCCEELAKPVTPINVLQLTRISPANYPTPPDFLPPEGYSFFEYFGFHKPYMRHWDTGSEAGSLPFGLLGSSNAYNILGAFDSIVGVGRPGNSATGETGQTCRIGGDGVPKEQRFAQMLLKAFSDVSGGDPVQKLFDKIPYGSWISMLNSFKPGKVDPNTSWTELKQYQSRTINRFGMACLGRYEKLYKANGGEDFVLNRAGAVFNTTRGEGKEIISRSFPLAWRGYVSDPDKKRRFPYLGDPSSTGTYMGLGDAAGRIYAKKGDIMYIDPDVIEETGMKRLPSIAYVTEVQHIAGKNGSADIDYVKVIEQVPGLPGVCGHEPTGIHAEKTIYLNKLPKTLQNVAAKAGLKDTSCDDPNLAFCTENADNWKKIRIMRPTERLMKKLEKKG